MRVGVTISTALHAAALAWGLMSFSAMPFQAAPLESMPVDLITASEFSQMMAGAKTKGETAKPLVEKVAEPTPVKEPIPQVVDKPEIVSSAEPPPPAPETRESDAKPDKAKPEPKIDPIAEALKKDEVKKLPKAEAKIPTPPKKPAPPAPKFDADRITALLDKRNPRRLAAAGTAINTTPATGSTAGSAPTLSASEIDLLRARLRECWDIPAGLRDADKLQVPITIRFKIDGTLASPPSPDIRTQDPQMQAMIESAVRAIIRCQPYTMLSRAKYDAWKELSILFNPREMFGG
jgi:colicin import membrane protein